MPTKAEVRRTVESKEPPPGPVTYEQFAEWLDENTHAEWVDGEIVMTSPVNLAHERLAGFLSALLGLFVRVRDVGVVLIAPFHVYLPTRPSGREPDLMFLKTEHLDRLRETEVSGPPDAIVEIISPESVIGDRGEKFREYEGAGIPEYWLLDPLRREASFYQLGPDGRYHRALLQDDIFHSVAVPGLWLRVDWLWQEPLPDPLLAAVEVLGQEGAGPLVAALGDRLGDTLILEMLRSRLGSAILRRLLDELDRGEEPGTA